MSLLHEGAATMHQEGFESYHSSSLRATGMGMHTAPRSGFCALLIQEQRQPASILHTPQIVISVNFCYLQMKQFEIVLTTSGGINVSRMTSRMTAGLLCEVALVLEHLVWSAKAEAHGKYCPHSRSGSSTARCRISMHNMRRNAGSVSHQQ